MQEKRFDLEAESRERNRLNLSGSLPDQTCDRKEAEAKAISVSYTI